MECSPIVLFVYNRKQHTKQTVEALRKNVLSVQSDLIIFSDAPATIEKSESVDDVRQYINKIDGFKSVTIIEREVNYGLANSIIDGVSRICDKYGKVIVLEDDMVTSPFFLEFMNDALEKYVDYERVVSIHGYVYPIKESLPETFFLRGADCWGWATWSRGWDCFNRDGKFLLNELSRGKMISDFDFNGTYPFSKMLKEQIKGRNDSWAIRWYASAFLADKLTLYPGRSLVHNIGNDDSGTHCVGSTDLDTDLSGVKINVDSISFEPSLEGKQAFENFFKKIKKSFLRKLIDKIRSQIDKVNE